MWNSWQENWMQVMSHSLVFLARKLTQWVSHPCKYLHQPRDEQSALCLTGLMKVLVNAVLYVSSECCNPWVTQWLSRQNTPSMRNKQPLSNRHYIWSHNIFICFTLLFIGFPTSSHNPFALASVVFGIFIYRVKFF